MLPFAMLLSMLSYALPVVTHCPYCVAPNFRPVDG